MKGRKSITGILLTLGIVFVCEAAAIQTLAGNSTPAEEIQSLTIEHFEQPILGISGKEAAGHAQVLEIEKYTEDEREMLLKIAMAEAGNQHEDGMWLVMSVVVNRVSDPDWPDSIYEVIHEPFQFTSVTDMHFYEVEEITEECERAYQRILKGEVAPQIIAFERTDSVALDKYFMPAFEFKDHKFYTKRQK